MGIQVTDKVGGKPTFAQWDVDRELIITGATETPQLRFAHPALNRAIVVVSEEVETEDETASWVCKVPNFLMQFDGPLVVSVFEQEDGGEGKETALLKYLIRPRMKPQDYTYEENIGYVNWVQMSEAAQAFIESFPTYEAAIEALVADAGQSAQSAAASATDAAGSAGAAALSETNAGGSAAAAAGSAAAAAASVASIGDAGAAQIAAVNQAGATQVAAVQTKGEEVIASIPSDYTELADDVSDLKSSVTNSDNLLAENIHNLYEKTNLVYRYTQFDKGGFSAANGGWGSSSSALSEKGLTADNLGGYIILPSDEVHLSVKTGYRVRTYIYSSNNVSSFVEYVNWQTGEQAHPKWQNRKGYYIRYAIGKSDGSTYTQEEIDNFDPANAVFWSPIVENSPVFPTYTNPVNLLSPIITPVSRRFAMHRGYRTEAPENSIPAFTKAGEAGAWGIETDIRQTSDTDNSYFICLHSNDLAETTSGTGYVSQTQYSTIQTLHLTQGAHIEEYTNLAIPTFEQYLKVCKKFGCVAVIDVKGVRSYEDFINIVIKNGMEGSCVFLVYNDSQITSIRQYTLAPMALLASTTYTDAQLVDAAKNYYNVWVDFNVTSVVNDSLVVYAHNNKLPVLLWTVDNHADINTFFDYGVDIITSNSVATPAQLT